MMNVAHMVLCRFICMNVVECWAANEDECKEMGNEGKSNCKRNHVSAEHQPYCVPPSFATKDDGACHGVTV